MLACARIGAPHSVVFGGFSADALRDRINDCGAKVLLTQDGAWRRGSVVPLKKMADEALAQTPSDREGRRASGASAHERAPVAMKEGRDLWWHELARRARRARRASRARRSRAAFDAEHPLFILYTSGSTGKPKGVLHTTAGLPRRRARHDEVRLRPPRRRRLLVHGRRRLGHGPQLHRLRPALVRRDVHDVRGRAELPRLGALLEHHRAPRRHDPLHGADGDPRVHPRGRRVAGRSTISRRLRLLGSVGEPINPEAWIWYHRVIGGGRCPIVDTWWQTETGLDHARRRCPAPATRSPGSTGLPFVRRRHRRREGPRRRRAPPNEGGKLVIQQPVAVDGAHALGRRRALPEDVLGRDPGRVLHRRRRAPRRGRLLLGRRAHRRRAQRRRATASAPPRSRARSSGTRPSPRRRPSGGPTSSRARRSSSSSRSGPAPRRGGTSRRRSASTSTRRSASSRGPTRSASPTRCRRRAAARSCGGS